MSTNIMELLTHLDSLKHLKRTGWIHHEVGHRILLPFMQVPEPETVACHMYRMAVLAMSLDSKELDVIRCIKMALVHDIGEAIVGDITPKCGVSDAEKFALEEKAVSEISKLVPHLKNEWMYLWKEYEEHQTVEAKAVKQLDKLDMVAQALSYEKKYGIDLSDFFQSTERSFSTEPFISWNAEIRRKRSSK